MVYPVYSSGSSEWQIRDFARILDPGLETRQRDLKNNWRPQDAKSPENETSRPIKNVFQTSTSGQNFPRAMFF